jgi:hypothetical protein
MNTTAVSLSNFHPNTHLCGQSCRRRADIAGTWSQYPCNKPTTHLLINTDNGEVWAASCKRCLPKVSSKFGGLDWFEIVEVVR